MTASVYLYNVVTKYSPRNLMLQTPAITGLKNRLVKWAGGCYLTTMDSGSRAKGTAVSLASDVDYLVSLSSNCNENSGGLKSIYDSLYSELNSGYSNVRKQNVSVRINLNGIQVDVTPARKQPGATFDHWVYVSKTNTRMQTNIQKHISDIKNSGRINEIKVLKIWRELNKLEFPSIYLEYLIIQILRTQPKDITKLGAHCWHILNELALDTGNPLFSRIIDPANSSNVLSDLLTVAEKKNIISCAKIASAQSTWDRIVW